MAMMSVYFRRERERSGAAVEARRAASDTRRDASEGLIVWEARCARRVACIRTRWGLEMEVTSAVMVPPMVTIEERSCVFILVTCWCPCFFRISYRHG